MSILKYAMSVQFWRRSGLCRLDSHKLKTLFSDFYSRGARRSAKVEVQFENYVKLLRLICLFSTPVLYILAL